MTNVNIMQLRNLNILCICSLVLYTIIIIIIIFIQAQVNGLLLHTYIAYRVCVSEDYYYMLLNVDTEMKKVASGLSSAGVKLFFVGKDFCFQLSMTSCVMMRLS